MLFTLSTLLVETVLAGFRMLLEIKAKVVECLPGELEADRILECFVDDDDFVALEDDLLVLRVDALELHADDFEWLTTLVGWELG